MPRPAKPAAGVIGLGIIGSRAAANLRQAGYQVGVWNRSPRPEPNFLASAAEVAESATILQLFVSDGGALIETVEKMASALGPKHIVINHATVAPNETLRAAEMVEGRHAKFLDAPFTGSRDAAAAGELVFLIGGDVEALERARPQLEVNAKAIVPIGPVGHATVVKVATNLMAATAVQSLAEALSLLDTNGVPLNKLADVLPHHAVRSTLLEMKLLPMISGDFETRFALKHMFKDVQIALAMAQEAGADLPAAGAFAGSAMAALQQGLADEDFSAIAKLFGYPGEQNELPSADDGGATSPAPQREKRSLRGWVFGSKP
jgi:3-hydroxyisobutyrate dehydrogenase-like beta-hydroxyacid dehydrogenase